MIRRLHKGFTLIELMIVMVVISVLAAIALPSYNSYVMRAKRSAARTAIQNMAQQQERYFTQNNTYLTVNAGGTPPSGWANWVGDAYATRTHDLTVTVTAAATTLAAAYVISAAPGNGFNDTGCGTLTLTSTGVQSQTTGSTQECWSH